MILENDSNVSSSDDDDDDSDDDNIIDKSSNLISPAMLKFLNS